MTDPRRCAFRLPILAILIVTGQAAAVAQTARPQRVAVFGSSVALGNGDETGNGGYTAVLRSLYAKRGWEVLSVSRGGDNTRSLAGRLEPPAAAASVVAPTAGRPEGGALPGYLIAAPSRPADAQYLSQAKAGYVVIALSVANELIWEARTREDKDRIYDQYVNGMRKLIAEARARQLMPVIALCYPRLLYTDVEYDYVKRVNLLQNTWDVPSVNLLGALDNGRGQWAQGFQSDDKHPNAAGHAEFATAFVPTLFEALEKGKPTPVRAAAGSGFARASGGAALSFTPEWPVHSFALHMAVRAQGDGVVATLTGSTLGVRADGKKVYVQGANVEFDEYWVTRDRPFTAVLGVEQGMWMYKAANGNIIKSVVPADSQWHQLTLSHYMARAETQLYIDGKLVGTTVERLNPDGFVVGGAARQTDYRDVFIYRSALNAEEVSALHAGRMIQASMEVYAPLGDAAFRSGSAVENRAQSLAELKLVAGSLAHIAEPVSR